ncbi:hypothetical protein DITRI_Ditri12bG0012800 [Diplodiscus trichospermus]
MASSSTQVGVCDSVVTPPTKIFAEGEGLWKNVVVAQFIGQTPNFSLFQRLVRVMWNFGGELEISPTGSNLFIIQFTSLDARDRVLEQGPWHIQNKPLIVRKWEPSMSSLDFDLAKIPIWIHLRNVPLELFTRSGLSYIASAVGIPLYMDRITTSYQRLAYAKVCVEIEVSSKIPSSIEVRMKDGSPISISVEVPWHPQRCTNCSLFGHSPNTCQRKSSYNH